MGRSVAMLPAGDKDRELRTFPRAAFDYLPASDPPSLGVIGGQKGPGWFSGVQREDQRHGSLYKLNTQLKCYDFVHRLSAKKPAALRPLHLSHIEYLRFSLCIASGEYVPCDHTDHHDALLTSAVRWKCITCGKEPVGDHHAHRSHTGDRPFSSRARNICSRPLALVVDQIEVHLQQMQDCINTCFGDTSRDPRRSMEHLGSLKAQALQTWEDFLDDDRASTLSERPFGSSPHGGFSGP